ncbi:MAG: hypothetical protein AAGC55_28165, partial [Myxococcota bacterium]
MKLSTADLGLFFAPHHHRLAEWLGGLGEPLTAAEKSAEGVARDRAVADEMGRLGLYHWLIPESLLNRPEASDGASDGAAAGASAGAAEADPSRPAIDIRALCLIREYLGYLSPLADSIFAVQGLGTYPIATAGAEPERS